MWQQLLHTSPYASPFQSSDFYDLCLGVKGMQPSVVALEDQGALMALMLVVVHYEPGLKAPFSRRGIVYSGPLLAEHCSPDHLTFFLRHFNRHLKQKPIYLEVRNGFDYSPFKEAFHDAQFYYVPWLNYHFYNINRESFKARVSKSKWRQLNKALNNGALWRATHSEDDVTAFYTILSQLYQHKVRKPIPPLDFFIKMAQSDMAQLLVVECQGRIVGGVLSPYHVGGALYEYYICGLDRDYPNCSPSTVAMWAMVCFAEDAGVANLDLMGAGQADKASSVREYKRTFGGELVEHGRFLMILKPWRYHLGRFVINQIRRP